MTIPTDGVHTLAYRSTDIVGTVEAERSATVRIDTLAPLTTDDAPAGWTKGPVTVHLSATDNGGSGVAGTQYKLDAGGWTTGAQVTIPTDGVHTLAYRSTDIVGTVEAERSATVRIDTLAPLTTDDAPAGWTKGPVTVHLSATDNGGSGVAATQYKLDAGGWTTGAQVTIPTDGVHTLAYRSTDIVGTVRPQSATVRIDTLAPLTTDDAPAGWTKGPVTVHLSATDNGGSGVAGTQYKLDAGGWTTGAQVTISTDGVHTLAYRSTDIVGTVEAERSATVRIDTLAPLTTDDAPAGWTKGPVTVHLSATDNGGSGVAGTQYKLDAGGWTTGAQVTSPRTACTRSPTAPPTSWPPWRPRGAPRSASIQGGR